VHYTVARDRFMEYWQGGAPMGAESAEALEQKFLIDFGLMMSVIIVPCSAWSMMCAMRAAGRILLVFLAQGRGRAGRGRRDGGCAAHHSSDDG
jgi:hypothetical protein